MPPTVSIGLMRGLKCREQLSAAISNARRSTSCICIRILLHLHIRHSGYEQLPGTYFFAGAAPLSSNDPENFARPRRMIPQSSTSAATQISGARSRASYTLSDRRWSCRPPSDRGPHGGCAPRRAAHRCAVPHAIQPGLVVEIHCVRNERVTLPVPDRVAHPQRPEACVMLPPVRVNLMPQRSHTRKA